MKTLKTLALTVALAACQPVSAQMFDAEELCQRDLNIATEVVGDYVNGMQFNDIYLKNSRRFKAAGEAYTNLLYEYVSRVDLGPEEIYFQFPIMVFDDCKEQMEAFNSLYNK